MLDIWVNSVCWFGWNFGRCVVVCGGVWRCGSSATQGGMNSRERGLGYPHPWAIQILLKTSIELSQSTVLQVCDTLLLVLDITPRSQLVGRHGG